MARNGIGVLMAASLCAAAVLSAPARAEDSLFDRPAAQTPVAQAPKPAPKPKHVAAKHKPKPAEAASVPATPAPVPPVVVQEPAADQPTLFGQEAPRQFLLNRIMNPAPAPSQAAPGPDGKPAAPVEPEEETLPNGMPKKFLLNRLFDSSALEPSQPDPRSFMAQAQAPASEPAPGNWWDGATKALGLGGKQETTSGNLPPVTVTAPARTAPPPPAPVAVTPPPREPSWLDRATGALGLGGDDKTVPDYSERPKLVVPRNFDTLPQPNPREERRVPAPNNAEALTKPPPGFLDKVQGADGKVSGFTEQDEGKKGWFNWF